MLSLFRLLLLLHLLTGVLFAQGIGIEVRVKHSGYIQYEAIDAVITIVNYGSDTLYLQPDKGSARLELEIIDQDRNRAGKGKTPMLSKMLVIPAGESVDHLVPLHKCYKVTKRGNYSAIASVRYRDSKYPSKRIFFDISQGTEVKTWNLRSPPREFSLRSVVRGRRESLALQIRDREGTTSYGVYDLGAYMRDFPPQTMLDEIDQVHMLHREGPREYVHSVFTVAGKPVLIDHYRASTASRPQLGPGPRGIMVLGASLNQGPREKGPSKPGIPEVAPPR